MNHSVNAVESVTLDSERRKLELACFSRPMPEDLQETLQTVPLVQVLAKVRLATTDTELVLEDEQLQRAPPEALAVAIVLEHSE